MYRKPRANGYWRPMATVVCECGNRRDVAIDRLKNGKTKSCGCLQRELFANTTRTHGLSNHQGYTNFKHMLSRCLDPRQKSYKNYGGRGIGICDEWNPVKVGHDTALRNFLQWFDDNHGRKGLTVERLDVNAGYYASNCTLIPNNQ